MKLVPDQRVIVSSDSTLYQSMALSNSLTHNIITGTRSHSFIYVFTIFMCLKTYIGRIYRALHGGAFLYIVLWCGSCSICTSEFFVVTPLPATCIHSYEQTQGLVLCALQPSRVKCHAQNAVLIHYVTSPGLY